MTQKGTGSASKDSSQALTVWGQVGGANGINRRIEPVQTTSVNSPIDRAPGITQRPRQLTDRDHSMLPIRELRQRAMPPILKVSPSFVSHSGTKEGDTRDSPPTQPVFRPSTALRAQKSRRPEDRRLGETLDAWS